MSSARQTSVSVMRPPKPPCWRDFVSSPTRSIHSEGVELPEPSSRALGARSPILDLVDPTRVPASLAPGSKPSKLARRPRARIHRTRSEHVIDSQDLPDSPFTGTLADAEPKGVRSARRPAGPEYDGRLYVEENNRRCQSWLASIEACEPLDEVDYTTDGTASPSPEQQVSPDGIQDPHMEAVTEVIDENGSTALIEGNIDSQSESRPQQGHQQQIHGPVIPIHDCDQGVDVEVPEETFVWSISHDVQTSSSSSGDDCCFSCTKSSNLRSWGEEKKKTISGIASCFEILSDSRKNSEETVQPTKGAGLKSSSVVGDASKTSRSNKDLTVGKIPNQFCDIAGADGSSGKRGRRKDGKTDISRPSVKDAHSKSQPTSRAVISQSEKVAKPKQLSKSASKFSTRNVLSDTDLLALDQATSD